MKYRWMTLAALAVLALSGVAASSAAATKTLFFLPQKGFPVKLTVKGGATEFYTEGFTVTCTGETTGETELTNAQEGKMKLAFHQCTEALKGCKSTGAGANEIKTGNVPVRLVYISKSKHEAALDINYQAPSEEIPPPPHNQLASWECEGVTGEGARWSIIAAVTPVNTSTLSHTVTLARSSPGVQNPTKYETEEAKTFEAFPELNLGFTSYFKGSITDKLELTSATEKVEIKA